MTQIIELDATVPAQDYVRIGGDKSPGRCRVRNVHTPRGWDVRQGYGLTGATLVPKGDEPATFELHFAFWDENDIPAWYAYAAKYFDKSVRFVPGSLTPKALGISHPQLSAPPIRITECVVADATDLENDGEGLWECIVSCLQYRKPKPVPSPPDAAIPAASAPNPTAQDSYDATIQDKLSTINSLAGG